jgi:hypothetical protein
MGGENCQWVAQIDHLIQPAEEKIFSLAYGQFEAPKKEKTPRKQRLEHQKLK